MSLLLVGGVGHHTDLRHHNSWSVVSETYIGYQPWRGQSQPRFTNLYGKKAQKTFSDCVRQSKFYPTFSNMCWPLDYRGLLQETIFEAARIDSSPCCGKLWELVNGNLRFPLSQCMASSFPPILILWNTKDAIRLRKTLIALPAILSLSLWRPR